MFRFLSLSTYRYKYSQSYHILKGYKEALSNGNWKNFASNSRRKLRLALDIAEETTHAHHKVPLESLKTNSVVQDAVDQGFDFNGLINGSPLDRAIHLNTFAEEYHHSIYNKIVNDFIIEKFASSGMNAKSFIENIVLPKIDLLINEAKAKNIPLNVLANQKGKL